MTSETGPVSEEPFTVPIGEARVARTGNDVTIVATSYMVIEALRAAERLSVLGIEAEIVDLRSLRPLDTATVLASVEKTGRLVVADTGWTQYGVTAEIVAFVAESLTGQLKGPPRRVGLPDAPTPTTHAIADNYYPTADDIVVAAHETLGLPTDGIVRVDGTAGPLDVPGTAFAGPF
jgi:pyruvate/2-oxoglutarate/acetoin dehydrogenase E1 component